MIRKLWDVDRSGLYVPPYLDEIVIGPLHMEKMENRHFWFAIDHEGERYDFNLWGHSGKGLLLSQVDGPEIPYTEGQRRFLTAENLAPGHRYDTYYNDRPPD